jgi:hypothetical protein
VIWIGFILIFLSGLFESVMDTLQFHYDVSIFKKLINQRYWYPGFSWMNKWKNGDPKQGERFLGSSTIFVGLTDAWHTFKLLHNLTIFLGLFFIAISQVTILWMIFYYIIARIIFGLSFSLFFWLWTKL